MRPLTELLGEQDRCDDAGGDDETPNQPLMAHALSLVDFDAVPRVPDRRRLGSTNASAGSLMVPPLVGKSN